MQLVRVAYIVKKDSAGVMNASFFLGLGLN